MYATTYPSGHRILVELLLYFKEIQQLSSSFLALNWIEIVLVTDARRFSGGCRYWTLIHSRLCRSWVRCTIDVHAYAADQRSCEKSSLGEMRSLLVSFFTQWAKRLKHSKQSLIHHPPRFSCAKCKPRTTSKIASWGHGRKRSYSRRRNRYLWYVLNFCCDLHIA